MRIVPSDDIVFHPAADIFPPMTDAQYHDLLEDIGEHGQREPIWVDGEGRVIDGRHRMRACRELGRSVEAREYHGDAKAITQFVLSLNLHRRHLDESQRSMVSARLANMKRGDNQHTGEDGTIGLTSQAEAAEKLNVSTKSVKRATKVLSKGTPELVAAVDAGEVAVSAAAEVVELPDDEQREAIEQGAVPKKAKEVREKKKAHVAQASGNNEWYTPGRIIELARDVMGGIDIDPASSDIANATVKADAYFTAAQDGLVQDWHGRVWLNPPYAQPLIGQFCSKLLAELDTGHTSQACVLVNNATETRWFQELLGAADATCFPAGRVRFLDPEGKPSGAPLQGQAILYFGDKADGFAQHFADTCVGRIWRVAA